MKTQQQLVKEIIQNQSMGIRDLANATGILEPSIRRVLGEGTKDGVFERIERGVYCLYRENRVIVYIETSNAIESLPRLARQGFKADMIFLDIPYKTRAVYGGNKPLGFSTITPGDFYVVVDALREIVRTDDVPVYYMYSKAKSGLKQMDKYTGVLFRLGFKLVREGEYVKTYLNGKPILNVRGMPSAPEGLMLFTKSAKFIQKSGIKKMNFKVRRRRGYPTAKPVSLCRSLVRQSTVSDDIILDSFCGSGTMGEATILEGRRYVGIDISKRATDLTMSRIEAING